MNRPTPETDELDRELHTPHVLQDRYSEMRDHAQKLERERDEAREAFKIAYNERVEMEVDRNKARLDAAQLADQLSGLELRTTEELARLERKRNEVICELRIWKNGKYELDP